MGGGGNCSCREFSGVNFLNTFKFENTIVNNKCGGNFPHGRIFIKFHFFRYRCNARRVR